AGVVPDARLVVSELVTNALRYGLATAGLPASGIPRPSPPIGLRLLRHPARLRCEGTDPSDIMPTCLAPDGNAQIGPGLCPIAPLTHHGGAPPLPPGGKCVWPALGLPP